MGKNSLNLLSIQQIHDLLSTINLRLTEWERRIPHHSLIDIKSHDSNLLRMVEKKVQKLRERRLFV